MTTKKKTLVEESVEELVETPVEESVVKNISKPKKMKTVIIINSNVLQKVFNTLGNLPYKEVAELFKELNNGGLKSVKIEDKGDI